MILYMPKSPVMKSTKDFFNDLVQTGLSESNINVSNATRHYLSDLLEFYIFSDHLFSKTNHSGKKQMHTMAELYLTCNTSNINKQRQLKKIGDTSLYISGFFRESLRRKMISVDYYIQMGQSAYESLSDLQDKELFTELAKHFTDFVFVFFCIYKKSTGNQHNYLLSLIDQYMDTQSHKVAKQLSDHGIHVPFNKNQNH